MKSLVLTCIFSACAVFTTSFAEVKNLDNHTKIYVAKDAIQLKKNHIVVHLPEGSFNVDLLGKDAAGYFVYQSDLVVAKGGPTKKYSHYCGNCQRSFQSEQERWGHLCRKPKSLK